MFFAARWLGNDYLFFAGYVVLQFIVLATAWNILGGYCGYVNFGSAAFFAVGAYTTVVFHKLVSRLPMPVADRRSAASSSGLVGLGMGYLTLRLRGVFFAIATLALAVVLQTLVVNWDFVGGSRGAYVIRPERDRRASARYIQYLFLVMLVLAVIALARRARDRALAARLRLRHHPRRRAGGRGRRRADAAAEADRHHDLGRASWAWPARRSPTTSATCEPSSAFGLAYAVNSIAMPMIGGTTSWVGPLIGAILLGTLQQVATVTISSAVNLLIVGVLLVGFVIIAPNGIVGLVQRLAAQG